MPNRAFVQNPNWPLIVAEYNPSGNYCFGAGSDAVWTDLTKRLIASWGTARGRQFELDAIQPGTWKGTWDNADGMLDPTNPKSPLNGTLLPYRPFRVRAQLPASTNRLTIDQATGGEGTPLLGQISDPAIISSSGPTGALFGPISAVSGHGPFTSWQGTHLWATGVQSGSPGVPFIIDVPVAAGNTYSFSAYVSAVPYSAGTFGTVTVQMTVAWAGPTITAAFVNSSTVQINTANPQAWTRLSVTGAPPAGATMASVGIQITVAPTAVMWLCSDGWQVELGPAPTPWTTPGAWYPMYTGAVERFPQVWTQGGSWGKVTPTAVDTLSLLAQTVFTDLVSAAVNAAIPNVLPSFYYPLNEQSGATTFADSTGQRAEATGYNGVVAGVTITSTDRGWTPAAAPRANCVTIPPDPSGPIPYLSIPPDSNGTFLNLATGFTRMIAFKPQSLSFGSYLWSVTGNMGRSPVYGFEFYLDVNSSALWVGHPPNTKNATGWVNVGAPAVGDWHLAFLSVDSSGNVIGALDGNTPVTATITPALPAGYTFTQDLIGQSAIEYTYPAQNVADAYSGDVAFVAQWPAAMTGAQMTALWTTWQFAANGESSGSRYSRILGYAGYTGVSNIDGGASQSLGPATDLQNRDALSCLQAVVDTENGQHYVDAAGNINFLARTRRYVAFTPQIVFGENTAAGEVPYEDVQFDFDPTRLANTVVITQQSTNAPISAVDRPSVQAYGVRSMTRTNQSTSLLEIRDAANWLLRRYKAPQLRVAALKVRPTTLTAWAACLALELGAPVGIMRRPVGGTPITFNGYVERLAWSVDDQANAILEMEVSPAAATAVWNAAAFHTTVAVAASAGAAVLQIPATSDAAQFGSDLPVNTQLNVGAGSTYETVTVTARPSTGSGGYLNIPVTALQYAHPAGDPVTDNISLILPSNKWDSAAVLDSTTILGY